MIAALTGILQDKNPTYLVLDVSGVGYQVCASLGTYQQLPELGETVCLFIHTNVREDDILLFGFMDLGEKHLFQKLIKVNGVGPRLAINILSGISANELLQALRAEDKARITAIPGIGKKTAERIILDLKDKLADMPGLTPLPTTSQASPGQFREDLLSVLQNLGYKRGSAEQALEYVPLDDVSTLQEAVRLTLRSLGEQTRKKVS